MITLERAVGVGAVVALVIALGQAGAAGQTISRTTAKHLPTMAGADNFQAYCAVCHGPEAKGNGPAAKALKTPPPDLTLLARRNGGKFSQADVDAAIRGTRLIATHGTREMPMWGPVFRSLDADDTMKLRVHNLVEFLRSIQVP